jgi:SSS family solute:Na+ symporter
MSAPKPEKDLHGLVYGLTEIAHDVGEPWYRRPGPLAAAVGICLIILNVIFW